MRIRHLDVIASLGGLVVAAWLCGTGNVVAATSTWTGGGGDANWTTGGNWGGTAPSAGDDLVFPGGAAQLSNTNNFPSSTSFNSIMFTGSSGGYTLGGNAIQLVAGVTVANSTGVQVISFDIALAASQTFTCPIDRLFIGNVDLGSWTLTLSVPNIPAVIQQNGSTSGTGSLITTGSGFVYLGASTYSGPTTSNETGFFTPAGLNTASVVTINSGLIQLINGASVGPVTVENGAAMYSGGGGISQIGNVTDLMMQSGSQLLMDMNSTSDYGRLNASGTVSVGGVLLLFNWHFTSSVGNTFTILHKASVGAITGTFVGKPEGAIFTDNGRTYQITYVGGSGNDVVITDIEGPAIPLLEAGGLAALAAVLALVGFALLRRRLAT